MDNDFQRALRSFFNKHNITNEFLVSALKLKEPDWVMILKLNAYVEALLGHAISLELKRNEITPLVEKFSMDGRFGKLEFAESLNLVLKSERKFLSALNKIRNHYAHGLNNFTRSLKEILDENTATKKAIVGWNPKFHQSFSARELSSEQVTLSLYVITSVIVITSNVLGRIGATVAEREFDLAAMKKALLG